MISEQYKSDAPIENDNNDITDPQKIPKVNPAKITNGVAKPIKKTQMIAKKKYEIISQIKF